MSNNNDRDHKMIEDNLTYLKGMFAGLERIESILTEEQRSQVQAIMYEIQTEHRQFLKLITK